MLLPLSFGKKLPPINHLNQRLPKPPTKPMLKLQRASKFGSLPKVINGSLRNSINPFKLLPVIHRPSAHCNDTAAPTHCNDTASPPHCNDTDVHNGPIKTPNTQTAAARISCLPPIKTNVRFTPSISRFYNPFQK